MNRQSQFIIIFNKCLKENGKPEAAIVQYKKSLDYAYGDNKLRVAASLAKLLIDAGKTIEAKNLLTSVIQDTTLPEDKEIRTHAYYDKLVKLNESLNKTSESDKLWYRTPTKYK